MTPPILERIITSRILEQFIVNGDWLTVYEHVALDILGQQWRVLVSQIGNEKTLHGWKLNLFSEESVFTVGSLFSGIGGIDLAFQHAGFEIIYQVEIDEYCQQVLKKHWSEAHRYRDIFTVDADALPAADVIAAGFPCQPFSVAGNQRGEADERFLWPEILRLVTAKRPRVVFLENVPGLRTNDSGNTFKRILRELAEIGYDAQWHHLRASDVGAPHRRERLFIVAYADSQRYNKSSNSQSSPYNQKQYCSPYQQTGNAVGSSIVSSGKILGNTYRPRLAKRQGFRRNFRAQQSSLKRTGNTGRKQPVVESRLGRGAHGLSRRMDRHQFPAPPGEQYAWEPARTTTQTTNRASRIKALGNAVVPQVVYPIALAIREWLEV